MTPKPPAAGEGQDVERRVWLCPNCEFIAEDLTVDGQCPRHSVRLEKFVPESRALRAEEERDRLLEEKRSASGSALALWLLHDIRRDADLLADACKNLREKYGDDGAVGVAGPVGRIRSAAGRAIEQAGAEGEGHNPEVAARLRAEEALREYGKHGEMCQTLWPPHPSMGKRACNCGLAAALAHLDSEGER